jgi:hypothetical protein
MIVAMKNLDNSGILFKIVYAILIVFGLFPSITVFAQNEVYQILNPKVYISCSGKLKNWNPTIDTSTITGTFTANKDGLEDVSDFHVSILFSPTTNDNNKIGAIILKTMLSSRNNEMIYDQERLMILPIMKQVYLSGDVKVIDKHYSNAMFLEYVVEPDQSITVRGRQYIWLNELPIKNRSINACNFHDELRVNIEFKLVKQSMLLAAK